MPMQGFHKKENQLKKLEFLVERVMVVVIIFLEQQVLVLQLLSKSKLRKEIYREL